MGFHCFAYNKFSYCTSYYEFIPSSDPLLFSIEKFSPLVGSLWKTLCFKMQIIWKCYNNIQAQCHALKLWICCLMSTILFPGFCTHISIRLYIPYIEFLCSCIKGTKQFTWSVKIVLMLCWYRIQTALQSWRECLSV